VSKRTGVVLRVLLAVALLVPVGVLFSSHWQTNDERRSYADRERHGIEYLRSLGPVTVALVDAQSSAVAGRSGAREALRSAVDATSAVDVRYGAELRTSERWAGVRAKIEALPDRTPTDPATASAAYSEAGDLLLALYAKVRESSGLIRDPESDSYHLQDAVAEELPEALVAGGRLADLTVMAAKRPASERLRTAGQMALARAAVIEPASDLVSGLRVAVENTESRTLGGNLLRRLDGYQRAVETLSGLTADPRGADPIQVSTARSSAHLSGAELSTIILSELDILIQERADELADQGLIALGALALAVLMIVALATGIMIAGRTTRPGFAYLGEPGTVPSGATHPRAAPEVGPLLNGPPLAEPPPVVSSPLAGPSVLPERRSYRPDPAGEPSRRSPLPDWPDPVPAGQANPAMPGGPDGQPAHWGRPDAAR
jgi:hypothetical protein